MPLLDTDLRPRKNAAHLGRVLTARSFLRYAEHCLNREVPPLYAQLRVRISEFSRGVMAVVWTGR